ATALGTGAYRQTGRALPADCARRPAGKPAETRGTTELLPEAQPCPYHRAIRFCQNGFPCRPDHRGTHPVWVLLVDLVGTVLGLQGGSGQTQPSCAGSLDRVLACHSGAAAGRPAQAATG